MMSSDASQPDRYLVELRGPEGYFRSMTVATDRITIGRSSANHVQVPDPSVSRHHTEVVLDRSGAWWVVDLGSQNGTFVDGERVDERRPIELGDPIQIEGFQISIRPVDEAEAAPTMTETRTDAIRNLESTPPGRLGGAQLQAIIDAGERFLHYPDTNERLGLLCRVMIGDAIGGVFAAIIRCDAADTGLGGVRVQHRASRESNAASEHLSRTLLNHVLAHRNAAYASQVSTSPSGVQMTVVDPARLMFAIACPISMDEAGVTVLYVNFPAHLGGEDWLSLAQLAVDQYRRADAVWELRMKEQHQAVAESELRRARQIQLQQVPSEVVISGLEVVVEFQANPVVGGGYVDAVRLADGRALMFLACASGKGLEAALITVSLHTYINMQADGSMELRDLMSRLNRFMCQNLPSGAFVPAVGMTVAPDSGDLEYVNFGHPPPWIVPAEGAPVQMPTDELPPMGMEVEAEPVIRMMHLKQRQLLVAHSRALLGTVDDTREIIQQTWQKRADVDVYETADKLLPLIDPPGKRDDDADDRYLVLIERSRED